MRKLKLSRAASAGAALVAVIAGTMTGSAGAARAATTADPNCSGYGIDNLVDPEGPYYSAAYIKNRTNGTVVGTVQFCERLDLDANHWVRWAAVTLYYDMSSGQKANGRVANNLPYPDHAEVLCSDQGGTGAIIGGTGDRTCATAGLANYGYWTERADAYVYGADGTLIAYGATDSYE